MVFLWHFFHNTFQYLLNVCFPHETVNSSRAGPISLLFVVTDVHIWRMLASREHTKKGEASLILRCSNAWFKSCRLKNHLSRCWRSTHIEKKYQRKKNGIHFWDLPKKVLGREWPSCWESMTFIMKRQFPTVNTVRNQVVLSSHPLPSLLIVTSLQSQPLLLN